MTGAGPVTRDVLQTLDEVHDRTFGRLDGLTDAEYLWEPVPACLTVRQDADGSYRADPRPRGSRPAPFSTIAWRTWHIGADCLRGYGGFFGVAAQDGDELRLWPGTAAEGIELLSRDWAVFRAQVASLGDERLLQPMGPVAGRYADESYLLLALHAIDEAAHHGAELGTIRDLYLHGNA